MSMDSEKQKTAITIKKIDHIGIAVKNLSEHMNFYQNILNLPFLGYKTVESQKVKVAMFCVGENKSKSVVIELLEPLSSDSPISSFLEKRGEGLHHICYDVPDIEATLTNLKNQGISLLDEKPKIGAQGVKIAFLHPKSTGKVLTELSQGAEH